MPNKDPNVKELKERWEIDFEDKFGWVGPGYSFPEIKEKVKSFISEVEEKAYQRGRVEASKIHNEYIDLLGEEIHSMLGIAYAHGWSSSEERIKRGNELREKINSLK
jgi:hypothetical protein